MGSFFYIVQKLGNNNFFSLQVELNFVIKTCLFLRFKNTFKNTFYFKLIFFLCFCIILIKLQT